MSEPPIIVIGGGPAGLMAAQSMAEAGRRVAVYDAMPTFGRKFLMAGRGGLNLTFAEPLAAFLPHYGAAAGFLAPIVEAFSPDDMRTWAQSLGCETFVGSSGRVFPTALKASGLLRAWLRHLSTLGVSFHLRHRWQGFAPDGGLLFQDAAGQHIQVPAAALVLALGGASWPRLGADGSWVPLLAAAGIAVSPLRPANMGVDIAWTSGFIARAEGLPLKRIALNFGGRTVRGEVVITRSGLEGGPVYALSAGIREALENTGSAVLQLDLRPDLTLAALTGLLQKRRSAASLPSYFRTSLKLPEASYALLRDIAIAEDFASPARLATLIKAVPLPVTGVQSLARAISTAGGIALEELTPSLMLKRLPGVFAAGEMLDWEAPTGGYLLQACMSTGLQAGRGVVEWLSNNPHHSISSPSWPKNPLIL